MFSIFFFQIIIQYFKSNIMMYNFFSYNRFPEDYVYFFYLIELGFREKKKKNIQV